MVLAAMIERVTQRLALEADAHRERARLLAALAPDILAFDESVGGERLRRYELSSGRGWPVRWMSCATSSVAGRLRAVNRCRRRV